MNIKRCLYIILVLPLFFLINVTHGSLLASESGESDGEKMAIVRNMYRSYKRDFPGAVDISVEKARALFEQRKVVFIDVRKPEEQAVSTLPGAVTEETFLENPGIARGKTAVAYCTIGYRSGVFSEKMVKQGTNVFNLTGGIVAWILDGGKVFLDGRETNRVHVYGKEWNHLPAGYEPVTFGFFEKLIN